MKTLDEVIKALEICGHDESSKCPYFDTEHWCCCEDHMRSISPLKNDALQYLKAYQWQMTNPDGDHQQLVKCQALLQEFYRNDPLSWDDLLSMKEKPVWAEYCPIDNHPERKQGLWVLVNHYDDDEIEFFPMGADYPDYVRKEQYHPSGWQAYRKERYE